MKTVLKCMICLSMIVFMAGNVVAQMTAAKRIAPMVEKKVTLNAPAEKVWEYVSDPVNYKKFSGVKEFTGKERSLNEKIELLTQAGQK